MPSTVQDAYNSTAKYTSQTCKATFAAPTTPGSLVIAYVVTAGRLGFTVSATSQTTLTPAFNREVRDLKFALWYRENCPSIRSVTISADAPTSMQVRLIEVTGIAQASALDKIVVRDSGYNTESAAIDTGSTGTTAQADELVIGILANQYGGSTSQSGFTGGLTRRFETTSPQAGNEDWERSRATTHLAMPTTVGNFRMQASLSTARRWISALLTFKGQSTGPIKITAGGPAVTVGGTAALSVFGRIVAADTAATITGTARVGPFNYQYLLGGYGGLLIGQDTPWRVASVEGLEGFAVRTSDDDLSRDDGATRGTDLQATRTILFKVNAPGTREEVEAGMAALYAALVPRRTDDEELIFRHPGRPLRSVWYRPVDLPRELNLTQALTGSQVFALRCVDPRIYSAVEKTTTVPVTPDDSDLVTIADAVNAGNARAYPRIQILGPTSGPDVTRVQLFNPATNIAFDVILTLSAGAELIGDMPAAVGTGSPRSVVTLDGTTVYGAWQQPRLPFYLAPNPTALDGANHLYLRTTPTNAPVTCRLTWRDTWSN